MKKNGFTFIELLVVITIIAVIFAAGAVSYTSISKNSRDARRKSDMESIRQALEMCRSIDSRYPTTAEGIYDGIECPVSTSIITLTTTPKDPKPCTDNSDGLYTYVSETGATYTLSAFCMEGGTTNPYTLTNP